MENIILEQTKVSEEMINEISMLYFYLKESLSLYRQNEESMVTIKQLSGSPTGRGRAVTVFLAVATIWLIITVAVIIAMMIRVKTPGEIIFK